MSGFTKGPWRAISNGHYFDISSEHGDIGDVCMTGHVFDGGNCLGLTSEANANLIATAPELLEALQTAMKFSMSEEAYNKCAAAVSKALGQ